MDIICYDVDGKIIESLSQWDINQKITITNLALTQTPEIHFSNPNDELALVTESTYTNGTLASEVPNVLLQTGLPIVIYIYVPEDDGSAKTVYSLRIPVIPRPKPTDYEFSNNAQFITYQDLLDVLSKSTEVIELANLATENATEAADLAEKFVKDGTSLFANAIKGFASGEKIVIDDISPIEHNVNTCVYGKNLFNGELLSGILSDNKFNLNTPTPAWKSIKIFLKAGTYTISFGIQTNVVRSVIDNIYSIIGNVNYAYSYTFTTKTDGYVGFSFRDSTSKDTAWINTTPIQIEKGQTATEYTPYINPSTVTVSTNGKNLFNISKIIANTSTSMKNNGDGTLTVSGTGKSFASPNTLKDYAPSLKVGEAYTLSADTTSTKKYIYLKGDSKSSWFFGTKRTITENDLNAPVGWYADTDTSTATISNIQIEESSIATDFEEYKGGTYTPNADGTCDVVSVSPTMILMTDTQGITMECDYNKDTNAVMGDIGAALDSIIAMQMSYIGGAE